MHNPFFRVYWNAFAGVLAALLFMLGTIGVSSSQEVEKKIAPSTIETGANTPTDTEIDRRIEQIFGELDGLNKILVSVNSGVVILAGEVAEAEAARKAEQLAARVNGVVAVENRITELTAVSERLVPVLGRFEKRFQQFVDYLPLAGLAFLVWLAISVFGWFISSRQQPWSWIAPNAFIADLIRQIVFLVFIVLGIMVALDILGATAVLGTILGAAGIVGLAIGFAVRDTVENYIASILLSIRQPFRPKDLVLIDGFEGRVIRLTSRATILMDLDGNHVRIPNATVFKGNILNYSRNPERRFTFKLGIDTESEILQAMEICQAELVKLPFILIDPVPDVWIEEIGGSNILIGISGWINQTETDFVKARSEAIRLVKFALETNGFTLPEPKYRLRIDADSPLNIRNAVAKVTKQPSRKKISTKEIEIEGAKEVTNTAVDETVIRKVDEERSIDAGDDLLTEDTSDEFGRLNDKLS